MQIDAARPAPETFVYRPVHGVPRWVFAAAGYAALLVAWAMANPLGAAPDEQASAVRAAGAAVGKWDGQPATPFVRTPGLSPAQADRLDQSSASFTFPAGLAPVPACFQGSAGPARTCPAARGPVGVGGTVTLASYAGAAPATAYVVAGLAERLPQGLVAPEYLGRLALAVACALLLAAAAWACAGRGGLWPMSGLALATTPMVLFLGSELSPSGVAICASICFAAAVLAFWLGPPRRGLVPLIVASAGVLVATKPAFGAVTIAAVSVAALPLVGAARLLRPGPMLGLLLVAATLVGAGALARQQLPAAGPVTVVDAIPLVVRMGPELARQAVGAFGSGDVGLPPLVTGAWEALVGLMLGAALVIARWRERLAVAVAVAAVLFVGAAELALLLAPVGWPLEGRDLLALAAVVPLLSGFLLQDAGLRPRADAFVVGLLVGGLQFAAFWENARRYAVGQNGPLDFVGSAQWAPPGGWMHWLVAAGAGCAMLALALVPLTAAEREDSEQSGIVLNPDLVSISR